MLANAAIAAKWRKSILEFFMFVFFLQTRKVLSRLKIQKSKWVITVGNVGR